MSMKPISGEANPQMKATGRSIPHDAAVGHVTGQAPYLDDLPRGERELWVEFVGSPVARGRIRKLHLDAARGVPGVVAVLTSADIPGDKYWGPIFKDEPVLAIDRVEYVMQPVVVIAAETREAARQGKAAVKIDVEAEPPILTIQQAIAADSFLNKPRAMARGDFRAAYEAAPFKFEGSFHCAGQEQFYLESQAALAIPGEGGQVTIHSSTQNPTEIQHVVASVLGVGMHEVVCVCKRMGGGFGGKETQGSIPAAMAALVTQKTGRAARVVYSKDEDMKATGKRHEYEAKFRIAHDAEGRILAADFDFWSNGGAFCDLSTSVLDRTLFHADNAYYIPAVEVRGRACKTNLPPNTAFRGFGGPQGVACMESAMDELAIRVGKDPIDVRRLNLYGVGERNVTQYHQVVKDHNLQEILDRIEESSDYRARKAAIADHNRTSHTTLRGLGVSMVKFGISFTTRFLNQGNALVNVFFDGTVQVSTGATEMGQGVNTKIRQLVADEFGLPIEHVTVLSTSTDRSINTSPTAASAGTDLNGAAAVRGAAIVRERIAEFAAKVFAAADGSLDADPSRIVFAGGWVYDSRRPNLKKPFGEVTGMARRERIDLGARGFYATPDLDFDPVTCKGNAFFYYTTGAAVAEVVIDRWTGALRIDRVDLLMDIGQMINPGIDRGQVIGGFVQGMGWCTSELLVYNERGELLSYSPTTYKVPGIDDMPRVFNVEFFDNPNNVKNIGRSKAMGEPPLLLGIAPWIAVKQALASMAPGHVPPLDFPCTSEEILRVERVMVDAAKSQGACKGMPGERVARDERSTGVARKPESGAQGGAQPAAPVSPTLAPAK